VDSGVDTERLAWIFLNRIPHLGTQRFHRLLAHARSAVGILSLTPAELEVAGVRSGLAEFWHAAFQDREIWRKAEEDAKRSESGEFLALTEIDEQYPDRLREVVGRPAVLYVKGIWPPPRAKAIGLVGTRKPTAYGEWMAGQLTRDLVLQEVVTVSGLAAGVDAVVHRETLQNGGYTLGVLGHGFQYRYPRDNHPLYEQILKSGAWVSEFPYETPPEAMNFPRRNRIIAGLSDGVVVVEAGVRSGALITARYAAEQGRDVYAVPGRAGEELTRGCHRLIKEGAMLVESVEDILGPGSRVSGPVPEGIQTVKTLSNEEKTILNALKLDPQSLESLTAQTGLSIDRLAGSLLSLELQNLIRVFPGQHYGLKK